ncbi:MAG: hypothetical protein AB1644_11725, partial [Candidatus Zixiibacteriota bacterium]
PPVLVFARTGDGAEAGFRLSTAGMTTYGVRPQRAHRERWGTPLECVTPAKAGVQSSAYVLDSGTRRPE